MLQIVIDNLDVIISILIGLYTLIKSTKSFKDILIGLYSLVVNANFKFPKEQGQSKLDYVLTEIYKMFPKSKLLKLIPKSTLISIIEGILKVHKEVNG